MKGLCIVKQFKTQNNGKTRKINERTRRVNDNYPR